MKITFNKYSIIFIPLLVLIFIFLTKPVEAAQPEILLLEGESPIAYSYTRLSSSKNGSLCVSDNSTSIFIKSLSANSFTKITNPKSGKFSGCQVSDNLQSIFVNGGWKVNSNNCSECWCSASTDGGLSFTAYEVVFASAVCYGGVSSNGQHFIFNKSRTLISNDYLNSFQEIDWSSNQKNFKYAANCSDTGVCISSMKFPAVSSTKGININNGFSNNYYLKSFSFEANSISPSGKYMCFINTDANISGSNVPQHRIYFSNNYIFNENAYFTNDEKFTNCLVDDTGKMYLWGLDITHPDRNKVVYLDLNKPEQPAQIFIEMELKPNVRILSFTGSADTNIYFFSEENGLIYQYEPSLFNPPNVPNDFQYSFPINRQFSDYENDIFYDNNENILIFENQDFENFSIHASFTYPENYLDYSGGIVNMVIRDKERNFIRALPTTKIINSNNLPTNSDGFIISKNTGFEINTCQFIEIIIQFDKKVINHENIIICLYEGLMPDTDKFFLNQSEIDQNFPFQKTYNKLSNKIIFGTFIKLEQNVKNLFNQLKNTSRAKNSNMKLYFDGQAVDLLEIKDNSTKGIYDFIYNISTIVFYSLFIVYIIFRARTFINND